MDRRIPQALQYSCRYWMHHLEEAGTQAWEKDIFSFLKEYFIHWLEAMSLMGLASETVGIISALQSKSVISPYLNCCEPGSQKRLNSLQNKVDVEIFGFLHDAYRFLLKSVRITNIAPLQVYCSGLAFSPTDSIIRETFQHKQPSWIPVLPQVEKSWSANCRPLRRVILIVLDQWPSPRTGRRSCQVRVIAPSSSGMPRLVQSCEFSRAIFTGLTQWPSPRTGRGSCRVLTLSSSGMPRPIQSCDH
jgi:hypothetical protein